MQLKDNIIAELIVAALLPLSAFADITYFRNPAGAEVTSPVTFSFSFSDPYVDFDGYSGEPYWGLDLTDYETGFDYCYGPIPISQTYNDFVIDMPEVIGGKWSNVSFYTSDTGVFDCFDAVGFTTVEGTGGQSLIFTVIENAGFSVISSGAAAAFLSGAASSVTTTGSSLWAIVAVILGIYVSFWVIRAVIALFPKRKR